MAAREDEILDESLARLARTGPEYRGGLSNHGPMAAEALVRLGRADEVEHWVDGYIRQLDDAPRASGRITDDTWREALGAPARGAVRVSRLPSPAPRDIPRHGTGGMSASPEIANDSLGHLG